MFWNPYKSPISEAVLLRRGRNILDWYLYCHVSIVGLCVIATGPYWLGASWRSWVLPHPVLSAVVMFIETSSVVEFLAESAIIAGPIMGVGMLVYSLGHSGPTRRRVLCYLAIDAPLTAIQFVVILPAVQ